MILGQNVQNDITCCLIISKADNSKSNYVQFSNKVNELIAKYFNQFYVSVNNILYEYIVIYYY